MAIRGAVHAIGTDIAFVPRFRRMFERYGHQFLRKTLHADEMAEFLAKSEAARPLFLASRWAVKEATFKCFQRYRVLFPEICVRRLPDEQIDRALLDAALQPTLPTRFQAEPLRLEFVGKTAQLATRLGITETHVSISHDEDYALAFVILKRQASDDV